MPTYKIELSGPAVRELKKLTKAAQKQIKSCFGTLEKDPRNMNVSKLKDNDAYRYRSGDFRILFEIHDSRLLVLILHVLNRKDAYKAL